MRRPTAILALLALACSGSPERQPPAAEPEPPPPAEPTAPVTAATDAGAAPVAVTPIDPATCASDADCAFDDPCNPQRCVASAAARRGAECDKSRPPTGTCVCFEKRCALKPGPDHPAMTADADCTYTEGCALDLAAGRCAPGRDADPRPQPMVGPRCDCDSHVPQRCRFSWLEPVACTSVEDCWVEHLPYDHPIKRPRAKKGKKFRPCKDGERAPACEQGQCTLLAYGC